MNKKFCSECGLELTSEDIFCPECGTKVFEDNKSNVEQVNVKTQSTPPPPPPPPQSEKSEAENTENYYTTPKESDTSTYYTPPIDEVQQESPVIEALTEDINETYDSEEVNEKEKAEENYYNFSNYYTTTVKEESKEFDPFKQNADAKTTLYGDHAKKTSNILLLIIVLFLVILGIVLAVALH
ncbi:MAG: zinc ribbon domain-containing protein [Lachnospiraceae bacterium]|nr:zinc ribbon domain-containing protein [Lachnospiraceae bacterium]